MAKRLTVKIGELEVICRLPTMATLWSAMGRLPSIPKTKDLQLDKCKKVTPRDLKVMQKQLVIADQVLAWCALRPKLLLESPVDVPEGAEPLEELDPMGRLNAFAELMEQSDLNVEDAGDPAPFSETAEDSKPSESSDSTSAAAPAPSSTG